MPNSSSSIGSKFGLEPLKYYIGHIDYNSSTYVTILSISGKGYLFWCGAYSAAKIPVMKVTIDGNLVDYTNNGVASGLTAQMDGAGGPVINLGPPATGKEGIGAFPPSAFPVTAFNVNMIPMKFNGTLLIEAKTTVAGAATVSFFYGLTT